MGGGGLFILHLKGNLNYIQEGCIIGTLDILGMFPHVPVQKTLEVVKGKLEMDESLKLRTEWEIKDIMKLLDISVETYFKTIDVKTYFQRDGLPIGKSILKPFAGIYMHWFEETCIFKEDGEFFFFEKSHAKNCCNKLTLS